jgi:hypothetical protein
LLLGTSAGFRSNSWSEELQDSDTASKGEGVLGDNSDVAQRAHLRRHGGHRAKTASSTHHAIQKGRIADWHGRWDLLGLE